MKDKIMQGRRNDKEKGKQGEKQIKKLGGKKHKMTKIWESNALSLTSYRCKEQRSGGARGGRK